MHYMTGILVILSLMTGRAGYVVPKEEIEKHGNLQKVAVGTGPFKLVEHVPGDFARFVRFDQYYEAEATMEKAGCGGTGRPGPGD